MIFLRQLGTLIQLDFLDFWRVRWVVAGFLSLHLAEALVFIVVLDRLISLDYIRFALPGVAISAASLAALDQSRRVFWELQVRNHYYLRSLPFSLTAIALARPIGAAMKAMAYSIWLLVPVAILGQIDLLRVGVGLGVLLGLGLGLGAAGVATGAVIHTFSVWSAVNTLLTLALVVISTAFYPIQALWMVSPIVALLASVNPVSGSVDLLRWAFHLSEAIDPKSVVVQLSLVLIMLMSVGIGLYRWTLTQER